jgi:hypothetical protein
MTIWKCAWCGLKWLNEKLPLYCPSCEHEHSIPKGPIVLWGQDIKDYIERDYGARLAIADKHVLKGLAAVSMGTRCPHGFVHLSLCNKGCAANPRKCATS